MPVDPITDRLIDTWQPPREAAQVQNYANGLDPNPGAAQKALELASKSNLPAPLIQTDPEAYAKDIRRQQNARILEGNDDLSKFVIDNPVAAQAAYNEYDKLDTVSRALQGLKTGWTRGGLQEQRGEIGYRALTGDEKAPAEAQSLDEQLKALPDPHGFVEWASQGLAGVGAGLTAHAQGAVGGAIVGTALPVLGTGAGFAAGLAQGFGRTGAGNAYLSLSQARDANGQPLSEAAKIGGAIIVGAANAAAGMVGVNVAGSALQNAVGTGVRQALDNPTVSKAITNAVGEVVKGGASGAGIMGALQTVTELVTDIVKGVSPGEWKTLANDPTRRQEIADNVTHAMTDAAGLFGLMHLPGAGRSAVADGLRIRQSAKDAAALDATINAGDEVTSKEALQALIDSHQEQPQLVGVPAERMLDMIQNDPESYAKLTARLGDITSLAQDAAARGDDVHLPLGQLLMEPEVLSKLRDDVRMRPEGFTVNEAKEVTDNPPDYTTAYHGSPHVFDAFSMEHIGKGEGAQSYGHGLYFAEAPEVAQSYERALSSPTVGGTTFDINNVAHRASQWIAIAGSKEQAIASVKQAIKMEGPLKEIKEADLAYLESNKPIEQYQEGKGAVYQVRLKADPERTILYDRPFAEQPESVKRALAKVMYEIDESPNKKPSEIEEHYTETKDWDKTLGDWLRDEQEIAGPTKLSEAMRKAGIDAIKYLDQASRTKGEGTHNYVVLDDKLIEITHRNGEPVLKQAAIEAGERSRRAAWLDPLLRPEGDKPPIGMTEAEYAKYSDKLDQLQAAVERKAEALASREVSKRQTEEWKRNEREVSDEVRTDFRYRPDILVDNYLRDGRLPNDQVGERVRLDRSAVEAILGEKEQLPRGFTAEKGGVHPDEIAPLFGYQSGQQMLTDLMALHRQRELAGLSPKKHFDQLVADETARRMEERYGKLDENIAAEAQEMVVQRAQSEVLGAELEALSRAGDVPIDRATIEANIHESFARMDLETARDLPGFMRAVARNGRAAELALLKDDIAATFQAKQKQYIAHVMAQSAKALAKDYARFDRLADRYNKPVLPSVEQRYTDQIQGILSEVGRPPKRNAAELEGALRGKPLADFIEQENGREIQVAAFLHDGTMPDFNKFTVQDFHDLNDSLKNLDHIGKAEKVVSRGEAKEALNALIQRALDTMADFPQKTQPFKPGIWDKTKQLGRQFDVALLREQQFFQWLSDNDPTGVFAEQFRQFADAKYKKHDMQTELRARLKALKGDAEFRKNLDNLVKNERLRDWNTGDLLSLDGKDLLAIMAHMGTESNFDKMTAKFQWKGETRGWDRADVEAFVKDNATQKHWDLVRGLWDINEEYFWPKVEEHSRRLAGIAPTKLEPRTISTEFGDIKGGYVPVDRDPRWPHGGGDKGEGIFRETQWRNAIPKRDYTLSRTEQAYPVHINFDSIINGMRETIHDLAYREPLLDGVKFLRSREIREAIQNVAGKEYADAIQPWLEHMAKGKMIDDATLEGLHRAARWSRSRLVTVELVGRLSTLYKHTTAAASNSIGEIGNLIEHPLGRPAAPGVFAAEALQIYGNAFDAPRKIREIMERSGELRSRWHSWDRDINEMANRNLLGDYSLRERASLALSYPIAFLDMASAIPVYTFAERHFIEKGFSMEEASRMADDSVRNAHGSAGAPDLPPVLRANEGMKLLTVAYNFFNHSYNRIRNVGRDIASGTRDISEGEYAEGFGKYYRAATMSLWYIFIIGLGERYVTHGGPDEDKEESMGSYAAKAATHQLVSTLPLGRDVGLPLLGWLEGKKISSTGPIGQLGEVLTNLVSTSTKAIKGDQLTGNWWQHFARGVGYGAGIPGSGQMAVSGQFLWDLDSGRQHADDFTSFVRGMAMGKSHPHERLGR